MRIFEYLDYKLATVGLLQSRPNKGRGELSRLARHLGVNATLVSQVLRGPKDFTMEQAYKLCEYFGFALAETEYMLLLVQHARAGYSELKAFYQKRILKLQTQSKEMSKRLNVTRTLTEIQKATYYSTWLYTAICTYTSLGYGKRLDEIATRFQIPLAKANQMMGFLCEAGLCSQENNIYRMSIQRTHLEFGSPYLNQHLQNWRMKATQNIERTSEEEMQFTACASLSREDFRKVREIFANAIRLTSEAATDSKGEEIACLNIDWFWVKS